MDRQSTEEQYWQERIRRMTQTSQDVSAGLYDDVLDPMREAVVTLITSQMPNGYAYDYKECQVVRLDPHLPDSFTIKGEAGNDLPVPAAAIIHSTALESDPERYETRTRPMPDAAEERYWEERIRRMTQMSQDVDDGLYDDVLIPMAEATIRLITSQMPDGYAYDLDECRIVRLDPNLPGFVHHQRRSGQRPTRSRPRHHPSHRTGNRPRKV